MGIERLITFVEQNQREYHMIIIMATLLLDSGIKSAEEMANLVFLWK